MINLFWGLIIIFGFILLVWYLEIVYETYREYKDRWRAKRKYTQARANARYIQKVDRYYHEV